MEYRFRRVTDKVNLGGVKFDQNLLMGPSVEEFLTETKSGTWFPPAEAVSVAERGFKCRVVTKSPECLVTLGDQLRKTLFKALMRDNRIAASIKGDHADAVNQAYDRGLECSNLLRDIELKDVFGNKLEPKTYKQMYGLPAGATRVLSSDLTAASDLLPLDLVEALVEGILEGVRW